jgi:hypothetical protein
MLPAMGYHALRASGIDMLVAGLEAAAAARGPRMMLKREDEARVLCRVLATGSVV